jgi:hypothetical protein
MLQLVFEWKSRSEGELTHIRVWKIASSAQYPEGIRYSMVYLRNGLRLVGYDNYHGKGHHRHRKEREEAYEFVDEWKAIEDFTNDVGKMRKEWKQET